MVLLVLLGIVFLAAMFPTFRCALFNPHHVVHYSVKDVYYYFKHKKYNNAPFGYIRCFVASLNYAFGAGKTLYGVHEIIALYRKYNGLDVWCDKRKKFVKQRILVLSNVEFKTIPYVFFESLKQFSDLADNVWDYDLKNDTLTVTYAVCDEASSQMNSRAFKSNFNPRFIEKLLTSRHFHASFYLTSQSFDMIDKLMREVVTTVVSCAKLWRFQRYAYYSPRELENATNEGMIQPLKRGCWFIRDKDYLAYDTHAVVETLKKSIETGDMLSDQEILALMGDTDSDVAAVQNFSRKYRRRHKRMN